MVRPLLRVVVLVAALGPLAASCASRDPEPIAIASSPPLVTTAADGALAPLPDQRGPMAIAKASHDPASPGEPPAATARPEVWTRCSSNPDCVLSRVDPETCCSTCDVTSLTRAQQDELTERCAARPKDGCPEMVCESGPNMAVCEDHTCTARRISPPRS